MNSGCVDRLADPTGPFYAQAVPFPSTVCGMGGGNGAYTGDFYRFMLPQETLLQVAFTASSTGQHDTIQIFIDRVGPAERPCAPEAGGLEHIALGLGLSCNTSTYRNYLPAGEYAVGVYMQAACRAYRLTTSAAPRPAPPVNDLCEGAIEIPDGGPVRMTAAELLGCDDDPEWPTSVRAMATVWYKHTAARSGTLSIASATTEDNPRRPEEMGVTWYESLDGTCNSLVELASTETRSLSAVQVIQGRTYYVQVGHLHRRMMREYWSQLLLDFTPPTPTPQGVYGWLEHYDAGHLPGQHQVPVVSPRVDAIYGSLATGVDVDMYEVEVCDSNAHFIATTRPSAYGSAPLDTRLFLFRPDGVALCDSDNSTPEVQSFIDSTYIPGPGRYLLAISEPRAEPVAANGQRLFSGPGAPLRAPDGPGAALPLHHWQHSHNIHHLGRYVITMYGACVITPACGTADFNGDGDSGTDQDIEAFFACLGGNCCGPCFRGGSDFNADGDAGTDQDIEAFFRVLGGGPCR
ncbi:MAG TPA: hypothetical protein VD997_12195 [Phycisphaerales bacterium]|nr:hypothetical protein [Phycisphaerales bacterium]